MTTPTTPIDAMPSLPVVAYRLPPCGNRRDYTFTSNLEVKNDYFEPAWEPLCKVSDAQAYAAQRCAELEAKLASAITHMDLARDWLTGGNPRTECSWGVLDTSNLRKALTPKETQ